MNLPDMRLYFTFNGSEFLVQRDVHANNGDIQLPDGTLLKVTKWSGSGGFEKIETVERIEVRTAGVPVVTASAYVQQKHNPPKGALS